MKPGEVHPLFIHLFEKAISFHPAFVKFGGVGTALMLSQLYYWRGKGQDPDGWIYKSVKDFTWETGLTRSEQKTARQKLKGLGILEIKLKGIPATLHYRVNDQMVEQRLRELNNVGSPQTSLRDSCKLDCNIPANNIAEIPQSITENTTKNITENTTINNEIENEFDIIWKKWPKKTKKQMAVNSFTRLMKSERKKIIAHVDRFIQNHHQFNKIGFIPHLSSYINQKRWDDEELPYKSDPGTNPIRKVLTLD